MAESLGVAGDATAIAQLIPMLQDADAGVRKATVIALGKLDDARAIHPLFSKLEDSDSLVCMETKNALYRTWDLAAVDPLLEELKSDNPISRREAARYLPRFPAPRVNDRLAEVMAQDQVDFVRDEALTALATMRDSRAVPPLIAMLQNKKPLLLNKFIDNRGRAARLLGQIRDPRAVEPLLKLVTESTDSQSIIIAALGAIGDVRAINPLFALLTNPDTKKQRSVIEALEQFSKTAVPEILPALKADYPIVRCQAARMLGRLGERSAVTPLIAALHDKDLTVKNSVIQALGALKDIRAVKPLAVILQQKVVTCDPEAEKARSDPQSGMPMALGVPYSNPSLAFNKETTVDGITLRISAIFSLSKIDDPVVVAPLVKAYNSNERLVSKAAEQGLRYLHNPRAGAALIPLLGRIKADKLPAMYEILGSIGGPQAAGYFIGKLHSADPAIRLKAISYLYLNTDKRVPAALLNALHDPDGLVRCTAANGLGKLKVAKAFDPLLKMLTTDSDNNARASAAYALGELKAIKAVPALIDTLQNTEDVTVFMLTCMALGNIGDTRAVQVMISAMKNKDEMLRSQAIESIATFDDPRVTTALLDVLNHSPAPIRPKIAIPNDIRPTIRSKAVQALALRKETGVTETLIGLLNDQEFAVRTAAVEALGLRNDAKAVEPLVDLLQRDVYSRQVVAKVLGQLKDPRAVQPLIRVYRDRDHGAPDTVIPALGAIGNDRAVAELQRIIQMHWGNEEAAEKALAAAKAG